MTQTFVHGYALLVGVGQCADPTLSLPVTVKDMQALRQILLDPNLCAYPDNDQHVRLLHDQGATRQAILEGLTWLSAQATADPEATAIVYYSGHGWLEATSDRYYLIPHDFDAYDWRDTALSADEFNQALHQIPAKRLLVILDCCHAAGMATAQGEEASPRLPKGVVPTADPKGLIDALQQGEGRIVFTSCRGEQSSWIRPDSTMSVYTHHLIEALQGAASQAGATEVTVFDLANHLGKAVPESAAAMERQQNPRFEMAETERFAIALLQGGKGLPDGGWDAIRTASTDAGSRVVTAAGERSIAVGGDVSGSNFVTGDGNVVGGGNVVQRGKYNLNAGSVRDLWVGDTYGAGTTEDFGAEEPKEEQTRTAKGYEPLPGQAQPLAATKYVCPEPDCDISWVRRSVGQTIPKCSIHHVDLVPVRRS
jgi:Caspase domain